MKTQTTNLKEHILSQLDFRSYYKTFVPSLKETHGAQAIGLCPFHDDHNPSLSVNLENGLFNCFSCGQKGDALLFYQILKGVDFLLPLKEIAKMQGITEIRSKVVATFVYRDAEGKPVYIKQRIEPGRNGRAKVFVFKHPEGHGKEALGRGHEPLLYNLPLLKGADTIFITEGEAKADLLVKWGFVSTCLDSGANSPWRESYFKVFEGKEMVVILPDADEPGKTYATKIANALYGKVGKVRVVELPGLPEGGDIIDWAKAEGNDKEKLLALVKDTPEWTPEKDGKPLLSSLLKWNDILSLEAETEYLLQNHIPKGSITLLFGRGGIGKTSLCLQIGRAIAEGIPFGGLQTIKTPVYYIDFENPLSVLKQRVENIGRTDNLWVWHISNTPMPPRLDSRDWVLYKELPPGLLIFDTLRASHVSDENNSQDMAIVIARLKELRELGFTILLLHHTPKGNEGIYKGSTALLDLVDHVLSIEGVKDGEDTIEFDGDNTYRLGTRIKTRYEPYHIFLKFNPEIKGFEVAKDPDLEKIETLYNILREAGQLKQKEFKERAKAELDLTEGEVRRLLKKGGGIAWDVEKGGHKNRALNYLPKYNWIIGQPIYSHPIILLESDSDKNLSNYIPSNSPQTLDNTELDNRTEGIQPINQLNLREGEL